MKNKLSNKQIAFIINAVIIVMDIYAFAIRPANRYDSPIWSFYTVLSNYITLFTSIIYLISCLLKKDWYAAQIMRFTSCVCLLVTFLVVVLVLVWYTDPLVIMFDKNNLYHHILIPALSIFSYILFENHANKYKDFIPVFVISIGYCAIMVYLNCIGFIDGPYPFFMVQRFGLTKVILYCALIALAMIPLCMILRQIAIKVENKKQSCQCES